MDINGSVMVGAGPIKTLEDVKQVAKSKLNIIVVGSITIEARSGNPGITYYVDSDNKFSINSKGLPNPGCKYYQKYLPEMVKIAHQKGKLLIVSLAGFTPDEYVRLSKIVKESGADGQELNFGCPNVWGKSGQQKRIVSFDLSLIKAILDQEERSIGTDFWTSIKLSPYSDPGLLLKSASIISASKIVDPITATNTFPNVFIYNDGKPVISFGTGLAALAGESMRPIVIGQIKQLKEILPRHIQVIASGGITEKKHIAEYYLAGAIASQVTSGFINEGVSIFERLVD